MNKVYKVVWNEVKNCYSVVSEIAKSHGKSSSRRKKTMVALMVFSLLSAGGLSYAAELTPDQKAVYDAVLQKLETEKKTVHYFSVGPRIISGAGPNYNNDGATGVYAVAIGDGAKAQGNWSTALGNSATAQETSSTALGVGAKAQGAFSTALGNGALAKALASTALGFEAQAQGDDSTALGNRATAQGNSSMALGYHARAQGRESMALGVGAKAENDKSTAIGLLAKAQGDDSTALGDEAKAQGAFSMALGNGAVAEALASTALGFLAKAQGNDSTALGNRATAQGNSSTALGDEAKAQGDYSMALGNSATAQGNYSMALGLSATTQGSSSMALGNSAKTQGNYSTALGNSATAQGNYSTALGSSATAQGNYSTAFGHDAIAYGNLSQATGRNAWSIGDYSQASGYNAVAAAEKGIDAATYNALSAGEKANYKRNEQSYLYYRTKFKEYTYDEFKALSAMEQHRLTNEKGYRYDNEKQVWMLASGAVAIGHEAKAIGLSTLAVGDLAEATGKYAVAVGREAEATDVGNTALGYYAKAKGNNSIAMGLKSSSIGESSIALGGRAKTQAQGSVAIGMRAESRQNGSVALGEVSLADRKAGVWGLDISTGQAMNEDTLLGAGKEAYDKAKAKLTELEGQEQTLRNQYEASLAQDPVEPNGNHIPSAATQAIENQLKAKEGEVFEQAIRVNDFVKVWQATKGAVSVGNTGLAATRQITNVAAGKDDTDVVNVAQLKKVNKKVDENTNKIKTIEQNITTLDTKGGGHYFSVKSDDSANPDGTNWNNDGATGNDAVAAGRYAKAYGNQSQATGKNAWSIGAYSQASGYNAVAAAEKGIDAAAYNALSVEEKKNYILNTQSEGRRDTSLYYRTKFKEYTKDEFNALPVMERHFLEAEKGYSYDKEKQVWTITPGAVAIGHAAKAIGLSTLAVGDTAEATGKGAVAVGKEAEATDVGTTAAGYYAKAKGLRSTALGIAASATDFESMAVGPYARAEGKVSLALGSKANAKGNNSIAMGLRSSSIGESSIALGGKAKTQAQGSVAIGMMAESRQKGSVALGEASLADREAGVWGHDISTGQKMNEDALLGAGKAAYDAEKTKLTELEGQEQTLRNEYEASLAQDPVAPNGNHIPSAATQVIKNKLDAKIAEVDTQAIKVADTVKTWRATSGALSVGNTGLAVTRQITGVAAGTEDTDAVNIAQLKKVAAMAKSAAVDIEAGDNNVTVNKDATTGKYKISAKDTTLKTNPNALSINNGKLNLSIEDTKGNKVTGSVDLNTIQGAVGTDTTYTMTGTEDSANNTTTIALKDNNGNEQKVTVATKDTNTYTTKATYDAGSKKLTFTRNDDQTYDVDFSGIAGSITGDTRNTIAESNTIAVDSKNKNADGSINYTLNVKTDGKVEKDNTGIVTGGTVYKETRIEKDGNYIKKNNMAGQNLSAVDKQVGINAKDINALGKKVDVNTGNINKNKEDINILGKKVDINTGNISKNKEGINALGKEVGINKENINKNTETINILGTQVGSLDTRVDKVGAGAAALAGLHPLDYDPENKWDFAAGYGNYNGANAIAIGAFYRPDENKMISIGGSFGGGENMISAGISVKVGQGTGISTSKAAMANEIRELKARDREREAQMQEIMRQLEILQKQAGK